MLYLLFAFLKIFSNKSCDNLTQPNDCEIYISVKHQKNTEKSWYPYIICEVNKLMAA